MTFKTPTLIAITAAFSLAAVSVQAEAPAKKDHRDRAAMHQKIDTNGDDKISVEEMVEFRTKHLTESVKKADADGDGFLTKEEIRKSHKKRKGHKGKHGDKKERGERGSDKGEKSAEDK